MAAIGSILVGVGAIASLVFWIMALVKAFKAGDTVWGIVGIFVGIVPLIYLFVKGHKGLAIKWIIAIVVMIIGYGVMAPSMIQQAKEMSEQIELQQQ